MPLNNVDRAVQFGDSVDMGIGENKAFPYIYNFIPLDDDDWVPTAVLADNLIGHALLVNSGATIQHPIVVDPDYNFLLLWFKYSAYYIDAVAGEYWWYDNTNWTLALAPEGEGDYQTPIGTPLVRFLQISVSVRPDSRDLYGGTNMDQAVRAGYRTPIRVNSIQGYDYGYGQVTSRYLLPKNSQIIFEITNNHPVKNLYVAGCAFGLKVRI